MLALIAVALLLLAALVLGGGLLDRGGEPPAATGAAGTATVARVVDGDTVVLSGLGKSRLVGIDTIVLWSRRVIPSTAAPIQRR